jgi:hypothetical protein
VSDDIKIEWYSAINDIIPTQDRLHRINIAATNKCHTCEETDNIGHRLTGCEGGDEMWEWTRVKLAVMLRTSAKNIPPTWLLQPNIRIWPPKRKRAVLWTLATFVAYRLQQNHKLTRHDFHDFMQRAKWKLQQTAKWIDKVGHYLRVLEEE